MTLLDADERKARDREERKRARLQEKQFRADVQEAMANPAMRRLVWRFLDDSNAEVSVFNPDAQAMAFNAGWQDAGRWWLEAMRNHCPEQEVVMRNEARRQAREGATDEDSDGSE